MPRTVGVLVMEHIAVGLVENNKLAGALNLYPEKGESLDALQAMPAENIGDVIRQQIESVSKGQKVQAVGLGFPGVIRAGIIEDSPNLHQVKGFNLQAALSLRGVSAPVRVFNDADAMAAGVAATRDKLEKLIRVWTLGNGGGVGRYPRSGGGGGGGVGRGPLGGDAGSERKSMRMRRARACGRNPGSSVDASAFSGSRARR